MSRTGAAVGMGRTRGRVRVQMQERTTLRAPHPWREKSMRLTGTGQEGQLVSVAFDMDSVLLLGGLWYIEEKRRGGLRRGHPEKHQPPKERR